MNTELRAAYANVITARREAERAKANIPEVYGDWRVQSEAIGHYQKAAGRRDGAEQTLRKLALTIFAKTNDRHIAPGVTVYIGHSQMPYAIIATNLNDLWSETGEAGGVE